MGAIHSIGRAEVQKFLGGNWVGADSEGLVPFHSQVSRSFKMEDFGSLLVVLELDDRFEFINDIVRAVSYVRILPGLL